MAMAERIGARGMEGTIFGLVMAPKILLIGEQGGVEMNERRATCFKASSGGSQPWDISYQHIHITSIVCFFLASQVS